MEKKNLANMKVKKKTNDKPWEKMYEGKEKAGAKPTAGKSAGAGKAGAAKTGAKTGAKAGTKPAAGKAENAKPAKPVKEIRDFLYLVPKRTSAKNLAKTLTFLDQKSIEIWEDECVLEIQANGIITFEDIRDSLEKEDEKVLNDLRMKQVISCDYESTDVETVQKVMDAFLKAFGGKIASDTEDFTPFLEVKNL
ncbi:MAG: hypothetical protein II743_11270 [Lachnospiraceae bacterium]|nr:hypothetical protein [Lachnospiraceae bacterium]